MDKIRRIYQEIERLKKYYAECGYPGMGEYEQGNKQGRMETLDSLLSFLDTLSEEPKSLEEAAEISFDEADALAQDYVNFLAKGLTENYPRPIGPHWFSEYAKKRFIAGAKWGAEHLRDSTKMIDKSLEEAAEEYLDKVFGDGKHQQFYKDLLIAGWKCRDEQIPMPEDTVLFQKGVAEGRRLEREDMLGDAISCEVDWYDGPILNYPIDQLCEVLSKMNIDVGDKVRIVVLKEEEQI